MTNSNAKTSPQTYARTAGILFLIILACSILSSMYVPSTIIVPGDATATAANIKASESLFRIGIVGDAILMLSEIALTVMLYVLLKPVSQTLSLIAAFARLAMTVMQGTNLLYHFASLLLLSGADYLQAFEPQQLHALVMFLFEANTYGAIVWGAFFGMHCLVLGYLIFKSGYFARILGALMVFASLGYLTDSFGMFLVPGYEESLGWVVWVTAFIGEFPFFLWLLIKGVNIEQWEKRALESA